MQIGGKGPRKNSSFRKFQKFFGLFFHLPISNTCSVLKSPLLKYFYKNHGPSKGQIVQNARNVLKWVNIGRKCCQKWQKEVVFCYQTPPPTGGRPEAPGGARRRPEPEKGRGPLVLAGGSAFTNQFCMVMQVLTRTIFCC